MDTCVCPSVHVWTETKKTHKLWSFVSKCPCMDCSFLQNTTSVAIFWYSWYFCGYFVYLQPHKTDSHTGKKTPKFMDKSSWTYRRSHTKPNSHTGKRHPNLWTKVATRHRFVGLSVRLSVSNITEKRLNGFSWNFPGRWDFIQGTIGNIFRMFRLTPWTQDFFPTFSEQSMPLSSIAEKQLNRFSWNFRIGRSWHREQSGTFLGCFG